MSEQELRGFTVRAYGLLESGGKILAIRERIAGKEYLKFPGGGVDLGEGTIDAVIREFMEELDLKVDVIRHLYTSDHFVQSAFRPEYQVIAVYYLVRAADISSIRIREQDILGIEWLDLSAVSVGKPSFSLDRKAMEECVKLAGSS
jgi:8-oxo-dGTP diphosphatase